MNNELKPYREYEKVDLLWIDKVPKHWKVVGNRTLWAERKTQNCIEKELLSVTIKKGIIKQADLLRNTSKKDSSNLDKSKYKLVLPMDIAYNKMRMWQGAVGFSKYTGIVSPAYIVLKPISELNPNYYHYLMRTPDYIEESHRYSYGMCDDQLNLRYEDFKQMKIIKPPLEEQNQIVKYLHFKLTKINKFMKSKKKLIEALKEQKQAVINEVITGKLKVEDGECKIRDKSEMKSSGIEWLGDIPKDWKCQKFSRVAQVKSNLVHPSEYASYIQVSPENIEKNSGKLLQCKTVLESGIISDNHLFYKGQILYSKVRPKLNKVTIAPFDGLCSADMYPIETRLDTSYLLYFMLSDIFLMQLSVTDNRVKMPKINKEELSSIIIVEPPKNIQMEVVRYIEKEKIIIDYAINAIEKEILLITEYCTSLISDVVTGKVDVRHIPIDEIIEEDTEIDETDKDEILDNKD